MLGEGGEGDGEGLAGGVEGEGDLVLVFGVEGGGVRHGAAPGGGAAFGVVEADADEGVLVERGRWGWRCEGEVNRGSIGCDGGVERDGIVVDGCEGSGGRCRKRPGPDRGGIGERGGVRDDGNEESEEAMSVEQLHCEYVC